MNDTVRVFLWTIRINLRHILRQQAWVGLRFDAWTSGVTNGVRGFDGEMESYCMGAFKHCHIQDVAFCTVESGGFIFDPLQYLYGLVRIARVDEEYSSSTLLMNGKSNCSVAL